MPYPTEHVNCEECEGTGEAEPFCSTCGGEDTALECPECENEYCRDCGGVGVVEEEPF